MAVTNINNLDGLDAVANIGAGGETVIKAAVKLVLKQLAGNDPRHVDLFVGQMAAEGFDLVGSNLTAGLQYTVESPTVKVEVYAEQAGQRLIRAYVLISAAWSKTFEGHLANLGALNA
jgi:acetyl-CoA acetyltransferase